MEVMSIGPEGELSGKGNIDMEMDELISKLEEALEEKYYQTEIGGFTLEYGDEDLHWVTEDEDYSIEGHLFDRPNYNYNLPFTLYKIVDYGEEDGEYEAGEWRPIKTKDVPLDPSIMKAEIEDILSFYMMELSKFIKENKVDDLDEIDLSIGHNPGAKPGIVRKFPQEKKGGNSLNLSVDDGPHQFPRAEDF